MAGLPKEELIAASCDAFLGYGRLDAPVWFVGKQQGGGKSFKEIETRLTVWDRRGRRQLEHLVEYHREIGIDEWSVRVQPTRAGLIYIKLAMDGLNIDPLKYQREHLAADCLLELLPLNRPKDTDRSHVPEMTAQTRFLNAQAPKRALIIRDLLQKHAPRTVVFYSDAQKFIRYWKDIAVGVDFIAAAKTGALSCIQHGVSGGTLFVIVPHPIRVPYLGMSIQEFFPVVGRFIASKLSESN